MKKAELQNASFQDVSLPFKLLERDVNRWVSELPVTDIQRCCGLVLPSLKALNRQSMPAITRFETLEELRPTVFLLSQKLESQFVGARFPFEEKTYESAVNSIEFQRELAHGYELVSMEKSFTDQIHFNNLLRARTLHRALQSYSLVMVRQGLLYQVREFESWKEVYGLFSFAERNDIHNVRNKDNETQTESSVEDVFKSILLFALSETFHYQQHDILKIYNFLVKFAGHAALRPVNREVDDNIASHYFKLDLDEPPRRLANGKTIVDSGAYRYLSTEPMVRLFGERTVPSAALDNESATYALPNATILESVLQRLVVLQERKFTRLLETKEYKLVFGLDHLIAVFSNTFKVRGKQGKSITKLDLVDEFELEHSDTDDGRKVSRSNSILTTLLNDSRTQVSTTDRWPADANNEILHLEDIVHIYKGGNSSPKGYCFTYSEKSSSKVKVGDLVGIYENESKINIGLISWLEYSYDGGLSFGIKLLSREAEVAQIDFLDNLAIEYTETALTQITNANALLLPAIPTSMKSISLLTLPLKYEVGNWIALKTRNKSKIYRLERLLDSSSAVSHFELFEFNDTCR